MSEIWARRRWVEDDEWLLLGRAAASILIPSGTAQKEKSG